MASVLPYRFEPESDDETVEVAHRQETVSLVRLEQNVSQCGGGGLIAVGFWMHFTSDVLGSNVLGVFAVHTMNIINVDLYFVSIGIAMFLLGFLGCCGAKKESKCLLIWFLSIIVIILVAELAIGLFALAYSSYIGTYLRSWARPALQNQYGRDFHFTELWNRTMTKLDCCGFNNYTDFIGSYYSELNGEIYPSSCCGNTTLRCDLPNAKNSMVKGCFMWIEWALNEKLYILGAVAAGVAGTESGAVIVALYLFFYLDKDEMIKAA